MKLSRKTLWLIVALLTVLFLLPGCNMIPEEYTKGVKLDSSYPEDDLPIMDDAVVYYCESDDETVSVKYGVKESLEDVADFYKDHFDDNDIVLSDESDKSSRYTAEGHYMDFDFEVKASAASGEYEEKVFETVVKIGIEFVDDSLGTISDLQGGGNVFSLAEDIIGFWRQESFEDSAGKIPTYEYGTAYEFLADGTLNLYYNYSFMGAGSWAYVDDATILLTAIDGTQENVMASIEKRSEKDYLIWTDSTGILTFFRDSFDEFSSSAGSEPLNADTILASSIADKTWYYVYYKDQDGNIMNSSSGYLVYYSNGTVEDIFDDVTTSGSWYASDGRLYCDYSDGSSVNWYIEVENINGTNYLYYYSDSNPGAYWMYADIPRDSIPGYSVDSTLYISDEEITYALIGKEFHELYYMYSDGTTEEMSQDTMVFYENGSLEEHYSGNDLTGTWQVTGGYLELYYDNGESYHYPAYIEYDNLSGAYYLYLADLEEGYEGCYWVFTTYEP